MTRSRPTTAFLRERHSGRLGGVDLARALAMLGMLVEHTLQYPTVQPKGILWSVYGRSGPLFVLLAGIGLTLAARAPRRTYSRAMIVARAPMLLLLGMALSLRGDGVILQSFALFFLIGVCVVDLPRWILAAAAGACLVGGPLFLTMLRSRDELAYWGTQSDVGFHALRDPATLVHGLVLSYYPAVIWMGFFFIGMLLGRCDLGSEAAGRRLFGWATLAAVVVFTIGWAGSRAFGPTPVPFDLAPSSPMSWSQNWTTYGFSNAVGWAVSAAALAVAVVGACVWIVAAAQRPVRVISGAARVLAPLIALGSMSLSFYVLHFVYLGTLWPHVQTHVMNTVSYFLASVAFWLAFAVLARQWLARVSRGPFEAVLHAGALALTAPARLRSVHRDLAEQAAVDPLEDLVEAVAGDREPVVALADDGA